MKAPIFSVPIVLLLVFFALPEARADLMGYWAFDDGSGGTLADTSGRGNDGTLAGTTPPAWVAGHSGTAGDTALSFSGSGGANNSSTAPHVQLGNPTDLKISGNQTISMWLYPTDIGTYRQSPYNKAYGGSGTLNMWQNGSIYYFYGTLGADGSPYQYFVSDPLTQDTWNHVTIVRDLSNMKLTWYINGNAKSTAANYPAATVGDQPAYFGRGYNASWTGLIDDAAIWNEALNPLQVKALQTDALSPGQIAGNRDDWLKGWLYRQEITIGAGAADSNLTDFPVPVEIDDAGNKVFANATANGHDGVTLLAHDLEHFSKASGSEGLSAWVNTPLSSSQDTTIYMYYGGPDLGDLSSTDTWDTNYRMVQHLNETSGTHADATQYGNDMTPANGVNQDATGLIDGADSFDGANDYLERTDTLGIAPANSFTYEAWVNLSDPQWTGNQYIIAKSSRAAIRAFLSGSPNLGIIWDDAGPSYSAWNSGIDIRGDWHHVVQVFDASQGTDGRMFLYLDGSEISGGVDVNGTMATGSNYYVGTWASTYGWVPGLIDEVRISGVARSADWLLAGYRLVWDPASYVTISGEQLVPEPSTLMLVVLGVAVLICRRRRGSS